jgi:hypothetical protein
MNNSNHLDAYDNGDGFSLAAIFKRPLTQIGDSRVKFFFVAFIENWRASPFASSRKLLVNMPNPPFVRPGSIEIFFRSCPVETGSDFRFAISWRAM